jgi:hypothetical protein
VEQRNHIVYKLILRAASPWQFFFRKTFEGMAHIVNNHEHYQTNSAVHNVNTQNRDHVHRPVDNLSSFHKSAYSSGIKIFNSLLPSLKSLVNKTTQFKVALKRYLNAHSFYSVDEFLLFKNDSQYFKGLSLYSITYLLYMYRFSITFEYLCETFISCEIIIIF